MKVVLLSEVSAGTVIGGAERVLREQALGLHHMGHHVSLVARNPVSDPRRDVRVGPLLERRYEPSRQSELAFAMSSILRSVRCFDQVSADGEPDVSIIHQSLAGFGPLFRRRRRRTAWVYMCLSLAHEEYLSRRHATSSFLDGLRAALGARLRRWVEGIVIRRCSMVLVLSEFMYNRVVEIYDIPQQRVRLLCGAADPTTFHPPSDRSAIRHELRFPLNKTILFTVRNLVPRMGLDKLIEAIASLGDESKNLILLIGGEGRLRTTLERLIDQRGLGDRVQLLGFIPEADLPTFYQAADIVVMPTFELEGFGLVTVEALACGTPVLGTPVGAIPEVLNRLDPALITEGTEPQALAGGIRQLVNRLRRDPAEQERLSARCRSLVERAYTWERHVEELQTALREVCPSLGTGSEGL